MPGWTPAQIIDLVKSITEFLSAAAVVIYAIHSAKHSIPVSVAEKLTQIINNNSTSTPSLEVPAGSTVETKTASTSTVSDNTPISDI